jgi:hypothetical protein
MHATAAEPTILERCDRSKRVLGVVPEEQSGALCVDHRSARSRAYLATLHTAREHLRCPCGVRWKVCQRRRAHGASYYLQGFAGQQALRKAGTCPLCTGMPPPALPPGDVPPPDLHRTCTLLGGYPVVVPLDTPPEPMRSHAERAASTRRTLLYSSVVRLLESVGFLGLMRPLSEEVIWRRLTAAFRHVPLFPDLDGGPSLADLLWTPASLLPYTAFLSQIVHSWRGPAELRPEAYAVGVVDHIPQVGLGIAQANPGEMIALELTGGARSARIEVRADHLHRIGRSGPYLVLAIALPDGESGRVFHPKVLALAILSAGCPVPVESNRERELVGYVQALQRRFFKPALPLVGGFRPDLMLLGDMLIIEVNGWSGDEYEARKAAMSRALRAHPAYRHWNLLTWHVQRQSWEEFERELRQALGLRRPAVRRRR